MLSGSLVPSTRTARSAMRCSTSRSLAVSRLNEPRPRGALPVGRIAQGIKGFGAMVLRDLDWSELP